MGERKVLNKYYPPDFDPAEMPKRKRPKTNDMKVRMMLPMTVQCRTCGHFMYKGTKFNTRKEDVLGQDYLGIQIYRFYYRCRNCAAEFTMKTDPKTSDYLLEEGASRNYEPWREQEKEKVLTKQEREEEEMGNAMKALENRTLESKREMDIMAALDEMRTLKSRHSQVTTDQALEALQREASKQVQGGLAAEEAADLQEFYALRAQQQQRQGTKLLHDSASSSGEEEDPSTHFRTRAGGPGPSLSHGAPGGLGGGTSNRGPGVGSRAASSQAGSSSSSATTAAALSRRRGGVGGAGRSLAALAMQDGEDDMAAEDHHQQQQQQQQQQGPPEGMAEVDATASGRQGLGGADGDGPGDAEQSQPADGHPTKSGGEAGRRVEDAGQRGDLLSDALASVQASKDKAAQPSTAKPPALKPQIKVMAKPKAAPAPVLPAAKESSQDDGPSGLGLLGSYGSSSSGSEDDAK